MSLKHKLSRYHYKSRYGIDVSKLKRKKDDHMIPFASIALHCASADGKLSEEEMEWFKGGFLASGRSEEFVDSLEQHVEKLTEKDIDKYAKSLSKSDKVVLLFAVFELCSVDGMQSAEKKAIKHTAKLLDLDTHIVSKIESLHKQKVALRKETMELIGNDWFA